MTAAEWTIPHWRPLADEDRKVKTPSDPEDSAKAWRCRSPLDTAAMEARIGFAGDWHGNVAWATSRLQAFGATGVSTVYQVGDFGLWPGPGGKRSCGPLTQPASSPT